MMLIPICEAIRKTYAEEGKVADEVTTIFALISE